MCAASTVKAQDVARILGGTHRDSVTLFGVTLRKGDHVLVKDPGTRPMSAPDGYYYVLMIDKKADFVKLPTRPTFDCTITDIVFAGGSNHAVLKETFGDIKLIADIFPAFLERELEVFGTKYATRFNLFYKYLSLQERIGEELALGYLSAFSPVPAGVDEFEKRRAVNSIIEQLKSLKESKLKVAKGQKLMWPVSAGNYDFSSGAFPLTGLFNKAKFDMPLGAISGLTLEFSNIDNVLNMPLPESEAEALTKGSLSRSRTLYCIYSYDLTDYSYANDRTGGDGFSATIGKYFVQNANVYKVDVYLDRACVNKVTTIVL